jgi:hypothetical protein
LLACLGLPDTLETEGEFLRLRDETRAALGVPLSDMAAAAAAAASG